MLVFGTRPEAIKMAPVVKQLEKEPDLTPIVVVTGQHREMLQQVLDVFKLQPDYDLKIMHQSQTLTMITNKVLSGLDEILNQEKPDLLLVHGDTTTTMAASLSAFYHHVPIGHVEAGLRTWNLAAPFPEEANRQLTDDLTTLYFAPTPLSRENLLKENHPAKQIFVTGNTAIDALHYTVSQDYHHEILSKIPDDHRIILLTMHRRENQGSPMEEVFRAVRDVASQRPQIDVVYPVHLSPRVQETAHRIFDGVANVHLIDPLDVLDFHNLAARSYFIMTDSGGVQEEAPSLNKPVLVLRDATERPEGVTAGTLKVVGTDYHRVKAAMEHLLDDPQEYKQMAEAKNPYGDGHAAERIGQICHDYLIK
ncbi:non-hydrolyzing UDP-N-acetylglucosamine 2-epimerase [Limosilactobacillus sp.]|jgi:UDP-N-acetylglucosamine 2-epimerase (non-hydrolysing)|uniref:non-hydrolyzing UDP-N-acetylglucosamine 2-epimerase n=1 Tax=Limosilactobacillus sp. TaxID=2773925 RepID=UPI003DA87BF7